MTAPLPRLSRDDPLPRAASDSVDGWLRVFIGLLRLPAAQAESIREELEGHLRDRTRDLMLTGLNEAAATRQAIAELGEAADVAARYRALRNEPRRRLVMYVTLFGTGAAVAMSLVAVAWSGRSHPSPAQPAGPETAALRDYLRLAQAGSDSAVRVDELLAQAQKALASGDANPALIAALRDRLATAQGDAAHQRLQAEQSRLNAANALRELAPRGELGPVTAAYQPRPADTSLSDVVLDVNADGATLQELFKLVSATANRPIEVEWSKFGTGPGPETAVTLHRQRISVPRLLEALSDAVNLHDGGAFDARIVDGTIVVSIREQFDRREETLATYDLSGIIAARLDAYGEERSAVVTDVVKAITEFVNPDDWADNGGDLARLQVVGDRLIVKAPARMLPQIEWLLGQLPATGRAAQDPTSQNPKRSEAELEKTRASVQDSLEKAIKQYGPDHRNVALLKEDLARIDQELKNRREQRQGQIHVYHLKNRDATEVACTLRALYPDWTITPDARTNSLLVKSPVGQSDLDAAVQNADGAGEGK